MSKSVLVIDTPEKCIRCPLLNEADGDINRKRKKY